MQIAGEIAQLPELMVTARTSAFHFTGLDLPIPEIAATLGVAHLALLGWLIAGVFQGREAAELMAPIALVMAVMLARDLRNQGLVFRQFNSRRSYLNIMDCLSRSGCGEVNLN